MAVEIVQPRWLSPGTVTALSRELSDPAPIAAARRLAAERVAELPMEPNPLYRTYGYFAGVELGAADPTVRGTPVALPPLGRQTVQLLHDASGTRFRASPDLPPSVATFTDLASIWANDGDAARTFFAPDGALTDRLSAVSAATLNRGYRLTIHPGAEGPIRVQDLTVLSQPREALSVHREIHLKPETSVLVTEEAFSTPTPSNGQRLVASTTKLHLDRAARAAVLTVHAPDDEAVAVYSRQARLGPQSRLTWMWNGLGGFRTKLRNLTELHGDGADVEDLQTFFGDRNQSYDSSIQISHIGRETHGQSVTRGVFRETARGMSRGLVRIESEARGTLSYLSEHAMLLSRGARSDTIPILEILCRDVKATHSTSVAPVDPEKVFYLESRGMSGTAAVRMIAEGFLANVLDRSPIGRLRDLLYPHLAARWDKTPILWGPEALPCLPALEEGAGTTGGDWRFDAKLR